LLLTSSAIGTEIAFSEELSGKLFGKETMTNEYKILFFNVFLIKNSINQVANSATAFIGQVAKVR